EPVDPVDPAGAFAVGRAAVPEVPPVDAPLPDFGAALLVEVPFAAEAFAGVDAPPNVAAGPDVYKGLDMVRDIKDLRSIRGR
ncbi:MAG: hypothetical protein MUP19_02935, partial [Candidatus Aminicenantes bacterium]|nr:hypothetical protein [Candidatus Aminicenantes bacterium]